MKKFLWLVCFFLLSACASLRDLKQPQVNVRQVEVQKGAMGLMDVKLKLEVENQNKRDFNIQKVQYLLQSRENKLAEGEIKGPWELKAETKNIVHLPVSLNLTTLISGLTSMLQNNQKDVVISGIVWVDNFRIPFKTEKKLNF